MEQTQRIKVENYLHTVVGEMSYREAHAGTKKEILGHLEDQIETARSFGFSEEVAVDEAITRMGDPRELGALLNGIHQPKFDFFFLALILGLCAFGLVALSKTPWLWLQTVWLCLGLVVAASIYQLSFKNLIQVLALLYPITLLGLLAAHCFGVSQEGQPYLNLLGLNIKIVDVAATLLSISFPALDYLIHLKWTRSSFPKVFLFMLPLGYFAFFGFFGPGLLFLIPGLIFLGNRMSSRVLFLSLAFAATALLSFSFDKGFVPSGVASQMIASEAHTDFILLALSKTSLTLSAFFLALFVTVLVHAFKVVGTVKWSLLRTVSQMGVCILSLQLFLGILSNFGGVPLLKGGVNIPFLSYGGSMVVVNFLLVGLLLACFKRRSISYFLLE